MFTRYTGGFQYQCIGGEVEYLEAGLHLGDRGRQALELVGEGDIGCGSSVDRVFLQRILHYQSR